MAITPPAGGGGPSGVGAFTTTCASPSTTYCVQNATADQMVSVLLGTGLTLVPGTAILETNTVEGSGLFSGGASSIGIDEGVLLTSGNIWNSIGPNDLSNKSAGGTYTRLKFNFTTSAPGVSWRYVFASEEYPEYVGTVYNDYFSLKLNGVNLAVLPGTINPVEINNVNAGLNSSFYVSNTDNSRPALQYDAFTTPLTSSLVGLDPGTVYQAEFEISDRGDEIFDSGVYIEGLIARDGTTPESSLLPTAPIITDASNPPAWEFPDLTVIPDQTYFYDPYVATGYIYSVDNPSGPLFSKYTAPTLSFDNSYSLWSCSSLTCASDTDYSTFIANITGGNQFTFPTPLDKFAIKDIDVLNLLDPASTTAFVAGIAFNMAGSVGVNQLPITVFYTPPDPSAVPGPLPVIGSGVTLAWSRRMRRRLLAAASLPS